MNIDRKTWIKAFVFVVLVIIAYKIIDGMNDIMGFFGSFMHIITPFVIGGIIAYLLFLPASKLENLLGKTKSKFLDRNARTIAVLLTVLGFLGVIALILFLFMPMLIRNITDFLGMVPSFENTVKNVITDLSEKESFKNLLDWDHLIRSINLSKLVAFLGLTDVKDVTTYLSAFISGLANFVIGLIAAIYILIDRSRLRKGLYNALCALIHKPKVERLFDTFALVGKTIYRFLYGQSLDSFIVGLMCFIVLTILNIPNAHVLALIFGICCLVPFFGSFIGTGLVALFTLIGAGWVKTLIMLGIMIVLQQIDGNIINPRIVGGALKIRPLAVIFGVTLGGGFFGVPGMLLGAPFMAVILQLFYQFAASREVPVFSKANFMPDAEAPPSELTGQQQLPDQQDG